MSWFHWHAAPAPQPAAAPFHFAHGAVFAFAPPQAAQHASGLPAPVFHLPWFASGGTTVTTPAVATTTQPIAAPDPVLSMPAVAQAPATSELALPDPVTPAPMDMPPQQSLQELDLYAQFAGLYGDFSGDQALSGLLGSDWAVQNHWQDAGGSPLG